MLKREYKEIYISRKREKEKKKEKRIQKKASGEDLGPSRKKLKSQTMEASSCKIRVAIDCSFDHLMSDKVGLRTSLIFMYYGCISYLLCGLIGMYGWERLEQFSFIWYNLQFRIAPKPPCWRKISFRDRLT